VWDKKAERISLGLSAGRGIEGLVVKCTDNETKSLAKY